MMNPGMCFSYSLFNNYCVFISFCRITQEASSLFEKLWSKYPQAFVSMVCGEIRHTDLAKYEIVQRAMDNNIISKLNRLCYLFIPIRLTYDDQPLTNFSYLQMMMIKKTTCALQLLHQFFSQLLGGGVKRANMLRITSVPVLI